MDKRFIVVLGIVILGLIGLFVFTRDKASAPSTTTSNASASNHIKGNKDSNVKLLVYGDFQCSACYQFYPTEKEVVDKYINDISFQFRHFPIESSHPNARASSRAAEAAGLQDKFFEMHDQLYENYNGWVNDSNPLNSFIRYAERLKLDINKFKTDFASEAVNDVINADMQAAQEAKVDGTPSYFLNGKKLNNQDISSVDKFSAIIEEALKNSN